MLKPKVFKLSDKAYLVSRISEVKDENCYIKLFRLFMKENVEYMRNHNGIFFLTRAQSLENNLQQVRNGFIALLWRKTRWIVYGRDQRCFSIIKRCF